MPVWPFSYLKFYLSLVSCSVNPSCGRVLLAATTSIAPPVSIAESVRMILESLSYKSPLSIIIFRKKKKSFLFILYFFCIFIYWSSSLLLFDSFFSFTYLTIWDFFFFFLIFSKKISTMVLLIYALRA